MESFYDNYCDPQGPQSGRRNYPIVCINYHKIWDNPVAVVRALGLPIEEADKVRGRGGIGGVRVGLYRFEGGGGARKLMWVVRGGRIGV